MIGNDIKEFIAGICVFVLAAIPICFSMYVGYLIICALRKYVGS